MVADPGKDFFNIIYINLLCFRIKRVHRITCLHRFNRNQPIWRPNVCACQKAAGPRRYRRGGSNRRSNCWCRGRRGLNRGLRRGANDGRGWCRGYGGSFGRQRCRLGRLGIEFALSLIRTADALTRISAGTIPISRTRAARVHGKLARFADPIRLNFCNDDKRHRGRHRKKNQRQKLEEPGLVFLIIPY